MDDDGADIEAIMAKANALEQQAEQSSADYTELAFGKQAQGANLLHSFAH